MANSCIKEITKLIDYYLATQSSADKRAKEAGVARNSQLWK